MNTFGEWLTLVAAIVSAQVGSDSTDYSHPNGAEAEIWVLAGQSNMQGGALPKEEPRSDQRILTFDPDDRWRIAGEPLQRWWLSNSPVFTNLMSGAPEQFREQCKKDPFHLAGVGPGLYFAQHLLAHLGRPIGLVPCAFGGTSMKQWDPALKDRSGESLYGDMMRRMNLIGANKIAGVLWYQGESEADGGRAVVDVYEKALIDLVDSIRRDIGRPDLPFIYVQIGRNARALDDETRKNWEAVREIQRSVSAQRKNVHMVSAIDLSLDDELHLSFEAQKQLGRRLAEVALSQVYGKPEHGSSIVLKSIEVMEQRKPIAWRPAESKIRVRFGGVSGRLRANGVPTGFELRMMDSKQPCAWLYRVDFDPEYKDAILVSVRPPYSPWKDPVGIIYGGGLNPYVNIVDEKDIPVPAFGPISVTIYSNSARSFQNPPTGKLDATVGRNTQAVSFRHGS